MLAQFLRRLFHRRSSATIRVRLLGCPLDGLEQTIPRAQLHGGIWELILITHSGRFRSAPLAARYAFDTPPEMELEGDQPVMIWHGRHVGYG